jgi:hypothetical protein
VGNWIWAYKALPESRRPDSQPAGRTFSIPAIVRTLANPLLGKLIVLVFVATFAFAMLETTLTMYLKDRLHVDAFTAARHTGPYFAYIGFLMALIQGGAIRRFRGKNLETILVVGGTLSLTIGLLGMALISNTLALLAPLAFVAFGSGFVNPSLTSLISRKSDANEMGQTLGASQGMSGLARILAPLAAGLLYGKVGGALGLDPGRPYLVAAVIMGLAFLMALTVHGESNGART